MFCYCVNDGGSSEVRCCDGCGTRVQGRAVAKLRCGGWRKNCVDVAVRRCRSAMEVLEREWWSARRKGMRWSRWSVNKMVRWCWWWLPWLNPLHCCRRGDEDWRWWLWWWGRWWRRSCCSSVVNGGERRLKMERRWMRAAGWWCVVVAGGEIGGYDGGCHGDGRRGGKLGLGFHVWDGGYDDVARSDWSIWWVEDYDTWLVLVG